MTNLIKVSANLTARSMAALEAASATTGDNETDTLNRAIQVYAYVSKVMAEGKVVLVVDPSTGARQRLVLL